MPRKVLLDSSFLFLPTHRRIDIFKELERLLSTKVEPVVLPPVLEEVEKIASNSETGLGRKAAHALRIAERCLKADFNKLPGESVDEYLVRAAEALGCPVATGDSKLRRQLRAKGLPVVFLREKTRLVLEGYVA
ncbi:hypothetical protein [Candidatus Hecatella orcuttiae]|uniref:type II toxin-antitoxin system VapC family toxin n=1 Tax=Candidatus Hecatella orcuttiae TaxID=1935119 RepID=UPI002867E4A5|nr:hypothetical protein [Candidatus Hecatella orcuttiae]